MKASIKTFLVGLVLAVLLLVGFNPSIHPLINPLMHFSAPLYQKLIWTPIILPIYILKCILSSPIYLVSYLIASIPFALIWGKLFYDQDIRMVGSQNIGATNAFRIGGFKLAILTFICDFLKGFLPIFSLMNNNPQAGDPFLLMLICVMGHISSIWLKFKAGGKGIATTFGCMLALNPQAALIVLILWLSSMALFKTSGVSSVISALSLPFLGWFTKFELPENLSLHNQESYVSSYSNATNVDSAQTDNPQFDDLRVDSMIEAISGNFSENIVEPISALERAGDHCEADVPLLVQSMFDGNWQMYQTYIFSLLMFIILITHRKNIRNFLQGFFSNTPTKI